MRSQQFIQPVQYFRNPQILGAVHGFGKSAPKLAQQCFPIGPTAGNIVQAVFQVRREVIGDIAGEIAFQKGCDNPTPVFGLEAAFFQAHVIPILKNGNDTGVGGRPTDAKLFHGFY